MDIRCLVLDHDDTVVNSTATIHYPAFNAYMALHHPDISMTLDEYFAYNFHPGVIGLFHDICGMSQEEMKEEELFWHAYVKDHIPGVYPGIRDILLQFKERGGYICVVSHSFSNYIRRDYAFNGLPEPDLVYGWDMEPALRKPDPYAVLDIEQKLQLQPEQLLVVDDLKPGYDMAKAAKVPFAASGWANDVPEIENFMRSNCEVYCKTVADFARYLGLEG